jgi:hypothetical protein
VPFTPQARGRDRAKRAELARAIDRARGTCIAQRGAMRSNLPSRLLLLAALSACGNDQPPVLVEPDAPDDPIDPTPNTVFVQTFGDSPAFIRYRTGGGEWLEPIDTGDGYELEIGDDFELIAVCESELGVDIGIELGTAAEVGTTYLPCFTPLPSESPIAVTGTMVQPGTVIMEDTADSTDPDWSFELSVRAGIHDLVAASDTHVAIRRAVSVGAPLALPAVDVAAEGAPFVTRAFTTDVAADAIQTSVLWFTPQSMIMLPPTPGATAKLPPLSLLDPADSRYIALDTRSARTYRSIYVRDDAGAPTDLAFLPALDPANVVFTADGAQWTGSLPAGAAELVGYSFSTFASIHARASSGWTAARGKLAIDTDIPGFRPEWRFDLDFRSFGVNDQQGGVFRYSAISE